MTYYRKDHEIIGESMGSGIQRKIIGYQDNLMLVKVFFEKGSIAEFHSHPHEQVGYILDGKFEFEIEGEKEILIKGDGFIVPPGIRHGATCLQKGIIIDSFSPMREDFL
jgi:quercetin dioxygenase-like cupin family protein